MAERNRSSYAIRRDKRALAEALFSGDSFGEALSLDLANLVRDVGG